MSEGVWMIVLLFTGMDIDQASTKRLTEDSGEYCKAHNNARHITKNFHEKSECYSR